MPHSVNIPKDVAQSLKGLKGRVANACEVMEHDSSTLPEPMLYEIIHHCLDLANALTNVIQTAQEDREKR